MKRRRFLGTTALACVSIGLPFNACTNSTNLSNPSDFQRLTHDLLKKWCDGMLKVQINAPDKPKIHGALGCPACNKIHGRCMDAVYPFLYMAKSTGEKKYLDAGIAVFEWSKNVSMPDGSWTVIPDPKSWRGITVFGAIALAEALHHHGDLLDPEQRNQWTERLKKAADYIYKTFNLTFTNINYGYTSIYALNLLGRVLKIEKYTERSRELAKGIPLFLTEPNKLLFGEGKPSDIKSPKGLLSVDLGYNVEESLNAVVLYALIEKDEALLKLLTTSLEGHLEFMLPDGAWDNSWGTRQAKWSYWGSRTTDGCQYGFGMMAERNPAFGTAAYLNTLLLQRCTNEGLLHGGPHYVSHGVKPCVHHTFAHAKVLASVLDAESHLPSIDKETPLPRLLADGVKEFPEVATYLTAKGPWRGTVTTYDAVYKEYAQQATGGALSILYHTKVGLIFTTSMAEYMLVEKNNQQPNPGEDFALTPRLESFQDGKWYTNIYDLKAEASYTESKEKIQFNIHAQLKDKDRNPIHDSSYEVEMNYIFNQDSVEITVPHKESNQKETLRSLVIPVVSPTGEKVVQASPEVIQIMKPEGLVELKANVPIRIKESSKSRIFNMVPGVEVVPLIVDIPMDTKNEVRVEIRVL